MGAIEKIDLMRIVANVTQIIGGILVLGDPLSPTAIGIALQVSALAMVCFSALLLPSSSPGHSGRHEIEDGLY